MTPVAFHQPSSNYISCIFVLCILFLLQLLHLMEYISCRLAKAVERGAETRACACGC